MMPAPAASAVPINISISTGASSRADMSGTGEFPIPGDLRVLDNDVMTFTVPTDSRWAEGDGVCAVNSLKLVCGTASE